MSALLATDNAATLLLVRAATPEQAAFVGKQAGGRVSIFLQTDDFDRDYRDLIARGVRPPAEQPYGKVAVFEDLYGNLWDLIGPAAPSSSSSAHTGASSAAASFRLVSREP